MRFFKIFILLCLGCLGVFANAQARSTSTVYSFQGGDNGFAPTSGLIYVNGTFYGTTASGGLCDKGTLFKIVNNRYTIISNLCSIGSVSAKLTYNAGTIYGVSFNGGSFRKGSVFSYKIGGAVKRLYSFGASATDGRNPLGVVYLNGDLYGVTYYGGAFDQGSAFRISGAGQYQQLHSFAGGTDGQWPSGGLIKANGFLYGATARGGANGQGEVFRLSASGVVKTIYSFTGGEDGLAPSGDILFLNGRLYGLAATKKFSNGKYIYSVDLQGNFGKFSPARAVDRQNLSAINSEIYILTDGGLYRQGALLKAVAGRNAVVLHNFSGGLDGVAPSGNLVEVDGAIYGVTIGGGLYNRGTMFKFEP